MIPNQRLPIPFYVYAVMLAVSGLLLFSGYHRTVYSLFSLLHLPDVAASALTGFFNLLWYEFGYVIGRSLESVMIFTLLPYVGAATSLVSALSILRRNRWSRFIVTGNLWFGIVVACMSVVIPVLVGGSTGWRLIASVTFLAANAAWLVLFTKKMPRPTGT
ncbi:MAG: hypothetical protein AAB393_04125 [Bacteroidota bacterium]